MSNPKLKTALVTGASSGMGKSIAKRLLKDGYRVAVAARRVEQMDDLASLGAVVVGMDVADEDSVVAGVADITEKLGGIDILVNNAGFGLYGAVEDIPLDEARYQFEVNVFGLARLTQLLTPHMREQRAGKIVNISSMGGKIYTPLGAWYHASKHAVEGLSDCLRLELAGFGIDVIVIEPGLIETEFGNVLEGPMKKYSATGAYAGLVAKLVKANGGSVASNPTSPDVIADTISRAVVAARPKTRYVVGRLARPLIAVRRWFGDRIYDRMVMASLR